MKHVLVVANSFTPPGSPPGNVASGDGTVHSIQMRYNNNNNVLSAKGPAPAADAGAILAALANLGKQTAATITPSQPPTQNAQNTAPTYQQASQPQVNSSVPQVQQPMSQFPPSVNHNAGATNSAPQQLGMMNSQVPQNASNINPLASFAMGQQAAQNMPPANDALSLQMQLVQSLASGQVPQEQIPQLLSVLNALQNSAAPPLVPPMNSGMMPQIGGNMSRDDLSQRQPYGSRYRDRSRSPDSRYRRGSPPHRRDSPTYGIYDPNGAGEQPFDRRGRGKGRPYQNDFRQRSPMSSRNMQSPETTPRPQLPKWVDYDYNLPDSHIKGIVK